MTKEEQSQLVGELDSFDQLYQEVATARFKKDWKRLLHTTKELERCTFRIYMLTDD